MRAFRVPEVFLLVGGQDCAIVGDEVGYVKEIGVFFFDDGAGDDADIEFFGE